MAVYAVFVLFHSQKLSITHPPRRRWPMNQTVDLPWQNAGLCYEYTYFLFRASGGYDDPPGPVIITQR